MGVAEVILVDLRAWSWSRVVRVLQHS